MRAFVALLLLCSVALADKPEVVDESDVLKVELAETRLALAKQVHETAVLAFRAKYHLGEQDGIDRQTLQIKRAPKPEKPKAK